MTSTLTVRSSADVIAAVPFLLGFHPADSLVVIGVRDLRVIFAARYDLPPDALAADQARHLAVLIARQGINGATLVGYGAADQVTPSIEHAAEALRRAGIEVRDTLRVTDGQFWSYGCAEPGCCPSPCPPADSAIAAAATYAGQVALPGRDALVAQLGPVTGAEREAMTAATAQAQGRLADEFGADLGGEDFARMLRRAGRRAVRDAERRYRSGRRLTDDEAAWLGVTLVDVQVRDYAWERTGEEQWRILLWMDVVRRVEPGYVPAPASLLSFAAWRQGLGALARAAAERALAHDPGYSMAEQMTELLSLAVSPETLRDWPQVDRASFDPERDRTQGRQTSGDESRRARLRQPGIGERAGRRVPRRGAHRRSRRRSV